MYDVVVCGGGPSGVAAAIASSRLGANTLLVEKYGFLGGMGTAGLVGPYMPYHSGNEQIITGIFKEICDHMISQGKMIGPIFDAEAYKWAAQDLCIKSEVKLLLHSVLTESIVNGKRIESIRTFSKSGYREDKSKTFVDTTGDADLAFLSGVPFDFGREEDGMTQSMTLMFSVGGVDLDKVFEYMKIHPGEFFDWCNEDRFDYKKTGIMGAAGFNSYMKKAHEDGSLPRHVQILFFNTLPRKGEVLFNTTNVVCSNPLSVDDLTMAEIEARRQVQVIMELLKDCPGFENAYLIQTAPQIGVRASRRIRGLYTFTGDDVNSGRKFDDVIARGSYGIDIHDPKGDDLEYDELPRGFSYDIPFRSLLPVNIENLAVAGRCISSDHKGQSAMRIQPICAAVGESAGTAAAISALEEVPLPNLDILELQKQLIKQGMNLGKRIEDKFK